MAMYNNGFPANYTPYYTPSQYQPQNYAPIPNNAQNNAQNGVIWVQGEAGAKSYLVAPNNTVQLWDSESQTIYLKSADASGMPTMKVLDYTIRESNKNTPNSASVLTDDNLSTFATKQEIKGITEQITALRDRVDNLTRKRRRDEEDE